jgi:protein-S-isoprenylcysteine O-methyltransferase Ste14
MATPATRHQSLRIAAFEMLLMMAGVLFVRREIWQMHVFDLSMQHWQEGILLPLAAIDGGITGAYASRSRNVEHFPAYRNLLRWGRPLFFVLYVASAALSERLNMGVFSTAPEFWRCLGVTLVTAGLAFRLWSQMSSPGALAMAANEPAARPPTEVEAKKIDGEPQTEDKPAEAPKDAVSALVEKISIAGTPGASCPAKGAVGENGDLPLVTQNEQLELFPLGPHKLLRYPDASGRLIALCGIPLCFNAWLPLLAVPGILTLLKWHISDQEAFRISQLGEPYLEYKKKTWNLIPYIY